MGFPKHRSQEGDPVLSISSQRSKIEAQREERASSSAARKVVIVLHPAAFAHDLFGLYMLNELGSRIGLTVGGFEIVSDRTAAPDKTELRELIETGIIPICVAGPFAKEDQDSEHNSVTLKIARELGADKDPVWSRLVRWVQGDHVSPGPGNWQQTLGMFRTLSLAYSHDQERAYSVFESIIDAVRAEIMEEVEANAEVSFAVLDRVFTIIHKGLKIKVGISHSDNELIVRAARHRLGLSVVVNRTSSGQATISAVDGIDLSKVAELVRREEAEIRGDPDPINPAYVGSSGLKDVWYYDRKPGGGYQALINGGPTSPQTEKTRIDANVLGALVIIGLKDR